MDEILPRAKWESETTVSKGVLRGRTWDHPRGFDSLIACGDLIEERFGVGVQWSARTLLQYGDQHVREFAPDHDLLVIDYPHVPDGVEDGSLLAFEDFVDRDTLGQLRRESAGPSHDSYVYRGKTWGLALDGATHVSVYRPDRIDGVPPFWDEVFKDARQSRILWGYKPVDAFSTFATVMAQKGQPIMATAPFIERDTASEVIEMLIELAGLVPDWCATANPIDVLEYLSGNDDYDYAINLYGYTNYSRPGFRKYLLTFDDVVSFDGRATGSQLGGAGIGVSSATKDPELAFAVAVYLASPEAQNGPYTERGGQPGNLRAWLSPRMNALTGNFFRNTLRSMEGAWVRPPLPGWPDFQFSVSQVLNRVFREGHYTLADEALIERYADELAGRSGQ